jgi:hypothetical protein
MKGKSTRRQDREAMRIGDMDKKGRRTGQEGRETGDRQDQRSRGRYEWIN